MPHALVEFSDPKIIGSEEAAILDAVFSAMAKSDLFIHEDIKVRSHPVSMTRNGTTNYTFIHATLRIMPGRTREQKHDLSQLVLTALSALPSPAKSTTVEVIEIDRDLYAKRVL